MSMHWKADFKCRRAVAIFAGALALALTSGAQAARTEAPSLDKCREYERELAGLARDGVRADLAKGPEWAKANLPAEKLNKVLRYLTVYEQLSFRCENIFARADAQAAIHKAREKARARALAKIPPPPVRKPKTIATVAPAAPNPTATPLSNSTKKPAIPARGANETPPGTNNAREPTRMWREKGAVKPK